jgi:hypothetical protein
MTYKEYLENVADMARGNPLSYGLYLAASGKEQIKADGELAKYLKSCYEKNTSPAKAVEDWI